MLAAGTLATRELVAGPVNEVRAELGLPPDLEASLLSRGLVLAPLPPRYRDPAFPLPSVTTYFRPFRGAAGAARWPGARLRHARDGLQPRVGRSLPRASSQAWRELPVEVVATVGRRSIRPSSGSCHPRYASSASCRRRRSSPRCSAVRLPTAAPEACSVPIAHGLPQVLIPMGADQPLNAARCEELGLARVLDPVAASRQEIHDAVLAVLDEPGCRAAAERLRADSRRCRGRTPS